MMKEPDVRKVVMIKAMACLQSLKERLPFDHHPMGVIKPKSLNAAVMDAPVKEVRDQLLSNLHAHLPHIYEPRPRPRYSSIAKAQRPFSTP